MARFAGRRWSGRRSAILIAGSLLSISAFLHPAGAGLVHAIVGGALFPSWLSGGGGAGLSDLEVERAVVYMANQAGAKFKEPAAAEKTATAAAAAEKAAAPAAGKADGKKIFESTCVVCHGAGIAGAPKAGDKAAWAPRLKAGMDALYASALKGKGAMPAKGGNNALADAEVKAAVDYLAGLAK